MALALLCTAQFVVVLDVTIVAVALPAIQADLGFSTAGLQWVLTAYTVVFGGLLIPAGRAGDLVGRRRLFRMGLALFAAASMGCGLAPSAGALVVLRAVQGLGAALLAPSALALVAAAFPESAARRRALAAWTAAAAGGGATGWVLGGVLTEGLGWRAVFFATAPVALAGLLLAGRVLPERHGRRTGLDLPGAAIVTLGLVALVLGLTRAQSAGFASWPTAGLLLSAAALLAGFLALERRVADPLLPPGVLGNRRVAAANVVAVVLAATTTPAMFLSILYQEHVLGRSATAVGLGCAPFNLAVVAGSLAGGRLRRGGARARMATGLAGVAVGALALTSAGPEDGYVSALLPGYALMGAGLGFASVASTAAGTAALDREAETGLASGLLNAAAQVGTVLGLAILVSLAAARTASLDPGPAATVDGYRWAFAAAAALALVTAAGLRPAVRCRA